MSKTVEQWLEDPLTERIARVFYAAVREWNDITRQPIGNAWPVLNKAKKDHLKIVVARALMTMKIPSAKELHERCFEDAVAAGWRYGPHEDRQNKLHPDIVPWSQLSFESRMKEYIIASIMSAFIEGNI